MTENVEDFQEDLDFEAIEDEVIEDNQEIVEDIEAFDASKIVVFSRDWTIETIFSQITETNIDLNPQFQRRNAWNDSKRSILIESIIMGYPIPEIVLAEDPKKKRSFIVIDGKQRLLTIAGFIAPDVFEYWNEPVLQFDTKGEHQKNRAKLDRVSYDILKNDKAYSNELREFRNSTIRTTVITNYERDDVLYDIFYRLNSGATPLSTQELRQVLNKGDFANYLITITNTTQPLHHVLGLSGPDKRLVDIEIILRSLCMILFGNEYTGNLKRFLDEKMKQINADWKNVHADIARTYEEFNAAIEKLSSVFGGYRKIGRKAGGNRFNRVLFEALVFYFRHITEPDLVAENKKEFLKRFMELNENPDFRSSIESTTKTPTAYITRFTGIEEIVNASFSKDLRIVPFRA